MITDHLEEKLNLSTEQLQAIFSRPVAYHKLLAIAGGSVGAGVFLSQLLYWTDRTKNEEGWVYKTLEDWWCETALGRNELKTIRNALIARQLIEEKLCGVPARLHYKIDWDTLQIALAKAITIHQEGISKRGAPTNKFVATPHTGDATDKNGAPPRASYRSESTAESTTETKTKTAREADRQLNGHTAGNSQSSSSSSLLLELPGLTEGAKTVPASPPVAQPDPVPSKAREPVVTPKKEERAFTPASKGQIRTNGESTSSDDPVALLRLVRANADTEPRGLAELVSEVFALSESQCAEIEHEIIARGSGIAIQAAEWTLQEYRESAGASYWSAFKGGFIPRKAIGQKKTELRKAKEQSRQAEPDPRETLSAEQLSANTAPLRALREARA